MSKRPYFATASLTKFFTSSALLVSHFTNAHLPPIFSSSSRVEREEFSDFSERAASRMSEQITVAPSRANARAVARPIPGVY